MSTTFREASFNNAELIYGILKYSSPSNTKVAKNAIKTVIDYHNDDYGVVQSDLNHWRRSAEYWSRGLVAKWRIAENKGISWSVFCSSTHKDGIKIIAEHPVPKAVIYDLCVNAFNDVDGHSNATIEIANVLFSYCRQALILKEEDNLLNEAKLTSSMPEDWDGKNIFARYDAVNLTKELVRNPLGFKCNIG
jgi:hypothetical protein